MYVCVCVCMCATTVAKATCVHIYLSVHAMCMNILPVANHLCFENSSKFHKQHHAT